jgi:membrane protease subunit (stomatin/prohibitin family)
MPLGAVRNVISTLDSSGREVMGPGVLIYRHPDPNILDGSLVTVESNHFCVLKSRGAVLNVYETGQYQVSAPDRPIAGSIQRAFYGGGSPWRYEAIYVSRAKSVIRARGVALSRELAELNYEVDYYVHVDTAKDAVSLVRHMPFAGHALTGEALNQYAGPVVEQAINQVIQVTPLELVNEHIHDISELLERHLREFLAVYGITLNDVKVLVSPRDARMKELISLKAFGLTEREAPHAYLALKLADKGIPTAVNALLGEPLRVGLLAPGFFGSLDGLPLTVPEPSGE